MNNNTIVDDLYQNFFSGDIQQFISRTFGYLQSIGDGRLPVPKRHELQSLVPVLRRWVQVVPVETTHDQMALLTARRYILACLHATGTDVTEFYSKVFGSVKDVLVLPSEFRMKFALLASIDCDCSVDFEKWQALSGKELTYYLIASLTDEPISEQGLMRFNKIVQAIPSLELDVPSFEFFADLSVSTFHLSYATVKEKYRAKRAFVSLARSMLERIGMRDIGVSSTASQRKPRICIITEHFSDNHAMHRCYGKLLESLKGKFETYLFAANFAECHSEIADYVVHFSGTPEGLKEVVIQIEKLSPSVVLYPSAGMAPWTFALSGFRLAPLQVALIGHPMPTCSAYIDYLAVPQAIVRTQTVTFESTFPYTYHPIDIDLYASEAVNQLVTLINSRKKDARLLIGITASSWKLNAGFMRTLATISNAGCVVEFRFFPNAQGLRLQSLQNKIHKWLPQAEVMPSTGFNEYLEKLAECDLVLQSFPFGGTNTTIDALGLGLPIVCMDGDDIHSRTDSIILESLGLNALLANDVDEYVRIACELISDMALRREIGQRSREAIMQMHNQSRIHPQDFPEKLLQLI